MYCVNKTLTESKIDGGDVVRVTVSVLVAVGLMINLGDETTCPPPFFPSITSYSSSAAHFYELSNSRHSATVDTFVPSQRFLVHSTLFFKFYF